MASTVLEAALHKKRYPVVQICPGVAEILKRAHDNAGGFFFLVLNQSKSVLLNFLYLFFFCFNQIFQILKDEETVILNYSIMELWGTLKLSHYSLTAEKSFIKLKNLSFSGEGLQIDTSYI